MKYWEALKSVNYENVLKRAAWTFLQGFLAVVILSLDSMVDLLFQADWMQLYAVVLAAVVGGIAAGLSALKTLVIEYVGKLKEL